MLTSFVLLSVLLSGVVGQFPTACTTAQALKDRRCCPQWKDGSMCGVDSGRGRCMFMHQTYSEKRSYTQPNDDRLDWPHEFYDSVCVCNGNYAGFDCGECKSGFCGAKCTEKKTIIRREIRELSRQERLTFFSYLSLAKLKTSARYKILITGNRYDRNTFRFVEASVYDVFVWMHAHPVAPFLQDNMFDMTIDFAHRGPIFLPWHRWYLLFFEREIQILTHDYDFALPYYDWSMEGKTCSICTDDMMGKSDNQGLLTSSSYFGNWKSMCSGFSYPEKYCTVAEDKCRMEPIHRNPGADPSYSQMPSTKQVEDVLQWKDYDTPPYSVSAQRSFRNALEGFVDPSSGTERRGSLHNLFHLYMGGSMTQSTLASNDPIFLLHHTFIDKIFDRWLVKYNGSSEMYPKNNIFGHGPNEYIIPSMPPVRNKDYVQKAAIFGYEYSNYRPPSNMSSN
ncbi:tyrosinase-like [Pleurodeles waltl]|uniref:tyrosinase-like n=1 Tax=Pleurodeles waltl TaxID=8319 RepID=UPI0037096FED